MPLTVASDKLLERMRAAGSVVVLTGAGASAESGIPTFRGNGGFWREFRPQELATAAAFERNPKLVWEWYMWRRNLVSKSAPNAGHVALSALENEYDQFMVITQNVDGLHQLAGSKTVIEIHGNILRSRCHACGELAGNEGLDSDGQIPTCSCGGMIRPDVVWFGELLPPQALKRAWDAAARSDMFFSVGTSSAVQPASGLADLAKQNGAYLVEINPETTELSSRFDEVLRGPAGMILPTLVQALGPNKRDAQSVSPQRLY